jgi:LysM repeat protein
VGVIGVIFYMQTCPPVIEIWEVMPDSQGKFALEVSQNEVEAVAEGVVACSSDGRAAVRVGLTEPVRQKVVHSRDYQAPSVRGGRDIQISLGPNAEGKVLHVVIDHALAGRVLGFVDTFSDEPPCQGVDLSSLLVIAAPSLAAQPTPIPYAAPVTAQAANEDGSIVHIVQSGDTIWQIGITYDVHPYRIISQNNLNELTNHGGFIFPGQKLLIRRAQ